MLKHDPVEKSKEYIEAMKEIQPIIDNLPEWVSVDGKLACKQDELLKRGIKWKTPREMNPDVIID